MRGSEKRKRIQISEDRDKRSSDEESDEDSDSSSLKRHKSKEDNFDIREKHFHSTSMKNSLSPSQDAKTPTAQDDDHQIMDLSSAKELTQKTQDILSKLGWKHAPSVVETREISKDKYGKMDRSGMGKLFCPEEVAIAIGDGFLSKEITSDVQEEDRSINMEQNVFSLVENAFSDKEIPDEKEEKKDYDPTIESILKSIGFNVNISHASKKPQSQESKSYSDPSINDNSVKDSNVNRILGTKESYEERAKRYREEQMQNYTNLQCESSFCDEPCAAKESKDKSLYENFSDSDDDDITVCETDPNPTVKSNLLDSDKNSIAEKCGFRDVELSMDHLNSSVCKEPVSKDQDPHSFVKKNFSDFTSAADSKLDWDLIGKEFARSMQGNSDATHPERQVTFLNSGTNDDTLEKEEKKLVDAFLREEAYRTIPKSHWEQEDGDNVTKDNTPNDDTREVRVVKVSDSKMKKELTMEEKKAKLNMS